MSQHRNTASSVIATAAARQSRRSSVSTATDSLLPSVPTPAEARAICEREGHRTKPLDPWGSVNENLCNRCGAYFWFGDDEGEPLRGDQVPREPPPPPAPRPKARWARPWHTALPNQPVEVVETTDQIDATVAIDGPAATGTRDRKSSEK